MASAPPTPPSDHDGGDVDALVAAAARGDADALRAAVTALRAPLLRRIRWMLGDEARRHLESGDVLQSALASALPASSSGVRFASTEALLRWLTTIARNKVREELRRRREEAVSALSLALLADEQAATDPTQPGRDRWELALDLAAAMERLDGRQRRAIELRDFEGWDMHAVAEALGCGERQARRVHAEALMRLARVLRASGLEGPER